MLLLMLKKDHKIFTYYIIFDSARSRIAFAALQFGQVLL